MFKIIVHTPNFLKNYSGMALYPFILLKDMNDKDNKFLINHECIHLRQQQETLVLPFYIFYGLNYAINRLRYSSHYEAYKNICFEREAYNQEHNLNYLKERNWFSFLKYLP
jgi:hypothetical protein